MRDVYAWIDPFEEISRLEREASNAYRAGEESVLHWLRIREFPERLRSAIDLLCSKIAQQHIRPLIERNRVRYAEAGAAAAIEHRKLMTLVSHAAMRIEGDGKVSLALAPMDPSIMTVMVDMIGPIHVAIPIDLYAMERSDGQR